MVFLFYALLGIIVGIVDASLFSKVNTLADFLNKMLLWEVVIWVGFLGIMAFWGHVFASEKVAKYIGWKSNGFQKELGFNKIEFKTYCNNIRKNWQINKSVICYLKR